MRFYTITSVTMSTKDFILTKIVVARTMVRIIKVHLS